MLASSNFIHLFTKDMIYSGFILRRKKSILRAQKTFHFGRQPRNGSRNVVAQILSSLIFMLVSSNFIHLFTKDVIYSGFILRRKKSILRAQKTFHFGRQPRHGSRLS